MNKILVADPLAEDGLERLRRAGEVTVVSKLAEDECLKDEHLGNVTGSPTREHWKVGWQSSFFTFSFTECRYIVILTAHNLVRR